MHWTPTKLRSTISLALVLAAAAPLSSVAQDAAGKPVTVSNLDFEKDMEGWKAAKKGAQFFTVTPEAGRSGKGVRVNDTDAAANARLTSERVTVTPGKTYEAQFYARSQSGEKGVGGYLVFFGADGKKLAPEAGAVQHQEVTSAHKDWTLLKLSAKAPANATQAALEIRSNKGSVVSADFDDFALVELP